MTNRATSRTRIVAGVLVGLLGAATGFFAGLMITLLLWVAVPDVGEGEEAPIGLLGLFLVTVVPFMMLLGAGTAVALFLRRVHRQE